MKFFGNHEMKFATIELNGMVHPVIAVDEKEPKFLNIKVIKPTQDD